MKNFLTLALVSMMTIWSAPTAEAQAETDNDIVDIAVAAGTFETLLAAVGAAELVEALEGDGPFTVLAPTDEAFAAALEALGLTAEELLADTETLTAVLTYHVLPGEVPSSDVLTLDGASVATVNGAFVDIGAERDGLVHVSQIENRRLNHPSDVLKEGQDVKVKLLGFDDRGKVRLSMKVVDQETGEEIKKEDA